MPETSTRKPSRTEIIQRVKGNVVERIGIRGPIPALASLHAMGLTHADVLHIVCVLEESFGVDLTEARGDEFALGGTVMDLIDLVEGQVGAGCMS